jgi:hypothetical protein
MPTRFQRLTGFIKSLPLFERYQPSLFPTLARVANRGATNPREQVGIQGHKRADEKQNDEKQWSE